MTPLRILVVDDEAIIRMDLAEILTRLGHEVVGQASSGKEAVAKSAELDPDLIFLDIKMPDMDGLSALRLMNEDKIRPVIILTAFSDIDLIKQAVELGVAAYLVKPFEASRLLPAIHVAMSHYRDLQALRAENMSLKETVEMSKLVNRAKMLLAQRENITEGEALRRIQKVSMDKNKKMKEVAEAVILLYSER
jgi:AmiR/NasT family two-component response regulator